MDEEQVLISLPGNVDVIQRIPERSHDTVNSKADADSFPSFGPDGNNYTSFQPETGVRRDEEMTGTTEPPVDWFEPLEEDDDEVYIAERNDAEEESLVGESELSESVAGSEKASKNLQYHQPRRRRRIHPDEGWEDCPALGFGWKRREVIRRSGSSMGQIDVYYLSPQGIRVRSRPGLVSVMKGQLDLSAFDFKTGKFSGRRKRQVKVRKKVMPPKKKVKDWSSSESSSIVQEEDGERDTPDSNQRLSPSPIIKNLRFRDPRKIQGTNGENTPIPSSSKLLPLLSTNGDLDPETNSLLCARCGIAFIGTWYDKQRKKPCCPTCWDTSKSREHPMVRLRKWFPCGECVACRNTINCGQCHNCTNGMHDGEARKRICQQRKCTVPVRRKDHYKEVPPQLYPVNRFRDICEDSTSVKSENTDSQHTTTLKNSDAENLTVNIDPEDDDDLSTDDDDDWHKKRKRRSCGECKSCLCRKDCGTCDFCIDKPKFGGSNKKRQKCRLRQCQRQAMRHLLPFQLEEQGENGPESIFPQYRPRIHYTYSRKSTSKKSRGPSAESADEDEDDDNSTMQPSNWRFENNEGGKRHYDINLKSHQSSMQQLNHSNIIMRNGLPERVPPISNHNSHRTQPSRKETRSSHSDEPKEVIEDSDEEDLPMITNVFSCADNQVVNDTHWENQLMKLLHSLRTNVLPIMWYAILVEGPQVQLVQCSKKSHMSDTRVLIDPGLCYQVTVQKQPLMPTHPIYDVNPLLLTTVTEVVTLLLGLEKYIVCQGISQKEPSLTREPIMLERAAICEFLVEKNVGICSNCRQLQIH